MLLNALHSYRYQLLFELFISYLRFEEMNKRLVLFLLTYPQDFFFSLMRSCYDVRPTVKNSSGGQALNSFSFPPRLADE